MESIEVEEELLLGMYTGGLIGGGGVGCVVFVGVVGTVGLVGFGVVVLQVEQQHRWLHDWYCWQHETDTVQQLWYEEQLEQQLSQQPRT